MSTSQSDIDCVITFGVDDNQPKDHPQRARDFRFGIVRIISNLKSVGYKGVLLYWDELYPLGCPRHEDAPFAFKAFCFSRAFELGFTRVLWIDSSVEIRANLKDIFDFIANAGFIFFDEDHSVGEYCKDNALKTLGITREESFAIRSCWACAFGLDLKSPVAGDFLSDLLAKCVDGITLPGPKWSGVRGWPPTASNDPRVHGHRYDQTAISVIARRLKMIPWHPKSSFYLYFRNNRSSIPNRPRHSFAEKLLSLPQSLDKQASLLAKQETLVRFGLDRNFETISGP